MLHDIFGQIGLKITAQVNNQVVNFLDITLNLENGKFAPYRKPNNQPLYVDSRSNHQSSILKQIPISINKRISSLSSDQESFDECKPFYESALKHSNYNVSLEYSTNSPSPPHLRNEGAKETVSGSTPLSANPLEPTSRGISCSFSINTSHLQVLCTKYSTVTQLNLAIAACLM
jgi:hypothetical protein